VRIELCLNLESSDIELLIKASKVLGMPIDALIKTAIADYLMKTLSTRIHRKEEEEENKQKTG
jgi:hypothetical protein